MTWNLLLPWPLVVLVGLLLVGFTTWRVVADDQRRRRWLLRLGTALAMVLALLGPSVAGEKVAQASTETDVVFVVDTTTSAMARDHDGGRTRLAGYREDVRKIQEELSGAHFSVITFDQEARVVLPLTTDASALRTVMETLRAERSVSSNGSSVTQAAEELTRTLEGARERHPERARLVFYVGDGEQTASSPPEPFDVGDLVDGGAVLGYGTKEGGRMARTLADGSTGEDVTDAQGNPGVSKIDEEQLQQIADQLGLPYVHRTGGDIEPAMAEADPGEVVADGGARTSTYTSLVWVPAVLASGLLLVDLFLTTREVARLRREP